MKIWYYAQANSVFIFLKKIMMVTSQARFKWTNEKLSNLIKCLPKLKSSMELTNCDSNIKFSFLHIDSFQWLQGFEVTVI